MPDSICKKPGIKSLREELYVSHMKLMESGLVLFSFGNISCVDREKGIMLIKPSGVKYEDLSPDNMVQLSLETGESTNRSLKASTDTETHLEIYRSFDCDAVVHTHSEFATTLAQCRLGIKCSGTTHADYFRGDIPCTRPMTSEEITADYEKNTGRVIVEAFKDFDSMDIPGILVANHAPFVWGMSLSNALENAIILEFLAKMEFKRRVIGMEAVLPDPMLIEKHYCRKHGKNSYYGQTRYRG